MKTVQNGIWSGILATSTMTLGFLRFFEMLPWSQRSPLPPGTLTSQITARVGLDQNLATEGRQGAALVSHFGYGIAAALIYAALPQRQKSSPLISGLGYGSAVWAVSYLGLIPALNLRAAAARMPLRRNALMIAAHWIWGATLGYAEHELRRSGTQIFDGHRKAIAAE